MANVFIAELEACEALRIKGLTTSDFDLLRTILPDNLTHVHSNGHLQDREELFDRMVNVIEFISIEREGLTYRFYGSVAVVTGTMKMTSRMRDTNVSADAIATVTQTWVKETNGWQQVAFQSARHP
ncbi:nuclear transport factor 2 family protein [Ensifer sp. ENS05]|uniref:nuclear transport factor 2 family protein n=1 Tax=Ensifer sp. ENS05 TaxID=2769277 RepID=UPI001785D7F6|nr:nuclear transport factor 2 family protein [Ensifer sp. ENS05]MBD9597317.1 nuclear transport factor 2 family protein [Ensifer sp. ENS05]